MQSKVVLITGASSGISAGIARVLAAADHTLVVGARRADRLETLVEELRATGATADAQPLDVTDLEDVQAFVAGAEQRHGRVDVLVNNAGVMPLSAIEAATLRRQAGRDPAETYDIVASLPPGMPASAASGRSERLRNRLAGRSQLVRCGCEPGAGRDARLVVASASVAPRCARSEPLVQGLGIAGEGSTGGDPLVRRRASRGRRDTLAW